MQLSSLDIRVLVKELQSVVGGRIQKVYHEGRTVFLNLHVPGKGTANIVAGEGRLFSTKYRLKHAQTPSNFCMFLRRRLKGQKIQKLEQPGFERIVVFETEDYKLIVELFDKGNIILTDRPGKIVGLLESQEWKDRTLRRGVFYESPPAVLNPVDMSEEEMADTIKTSGKRAIAFLARNLSMGGNYAEAVLTKAKVDYDKDCDKLTAKERTSVAKSIKQLIRKKEKVKGFNDEVDEFFVKGMEKESVTEEGRAADKRKKGLEHRLEVQKKSLDHVRKLADELKKSGDMIYEKFDKVQKTVDRIKKAAEDKGWDEAEKDKEVKSFDPKAKIVILTDGLKILLDKPLTKSAELYYEKSKKARAKIDGLKKSIKETEVLISKAGEAKVEKVRIEKKKTKKNWYDAFRWFKSSEGVLCVSGKDAATNELLIKRHAEKNDKIVHAEISGSPFTVVKAGGRKTLEEAAQFTASYSRAWRAGVGVVDAYWVLPDQVSKKTPAGEYMGRGSFMVYGRKNRMKSELALAIGFHDNSIIGGPVRSVAARTKKLVVIRPGKTSSKELAKQIKALLFSKCSKAEQEVLRTLNIEKIQRLVPAGMGSLEK